MTIGDTLAKAHTFGSWRSGKEWAYAKAREDACEWIANNPPPPRTARWFTWLDLAREKLGRDVPSFLQMEYSAELEHHLVRAGE